MILLLYVLLTTVVISITSSTFNGANTPPTGAPGGVIVHLFDWKYEDIAKECESFLGRYGYAGVQVSPVTEHVVLKQPKGWDSFIKKIPFNELVTSTKWYEDISTYRPWIERYEPVSYKIYSKSGSDSDFRNMVSRCSKAGVKVYVDVVLNHMTRNFPKKQQATGIFGSRIDTHNFNYPAVPYQKGDFNQPTCQIKNYNDLKELRVCEHAGLHDLNQTNPCVREKMRQFLNTLISYGVAGFRIDAAQFMYPKDLKKLFLTDFLNSEFGFDAETVPFVYHDIPNGATGKAVKVEDYYSSGRVMDYYYADDVSSAFSGIKSLADLERYSLQTNAYRSSQSIVFVDTPLTQRGMVGKNILTYANPRAYRMATAFVLAFPYGEPQIFSSYKFSEPLEGPPSEEGDKIASVKFDSKGCTNGWICEHRWPQIANMVKFRNAVKGEKITYWSVHGNNQISFGRGKKGFIVFNADKNANLTKTLQTGLSPGTYCDVISGVPSGSTCTGRTMIVDENSNAEFSLLANDPEGVIAIHEGAKIRR